MCVEMLSQFRDLRTRSDLHYKLVLSYTSVSPNVPEMEGILATEDVPLVELIYFVLACQVRDTADDSDLCCCVSCLSSGITPLCYLYTGAVGLILFQITTMRSEANM